MLFNIFNGRPYLCSGDRVYPVEIVGNTVNIDMESGELSNEKGRYTLREVTAKLGIAQTEE